MIEKTEEKTRSQVVISRMTFWETIKDLPHRFFSLFWKLLGFKGFVLGLTVWAMTKGFVSDLIFLAVVVLVLFGRDGLRFLKDIKE